jgi:propanol-preferring alcohol dehydrogenase
MTKIYKTCNEAKLGYYAQHSLQVNWIAYWGSSDLIELLSLAKREVIKPVFPKHFKLVQATDALQMLKDGKKLGRGVINP